MSVCIKHIKDEIETISEVEKKEPKNNHKIQLNLNVTSEEADLIRESLNDKGKVKLSETFELHRELEIMREVKRNGGVNGGGIEKTLELWGKEVKVCNNKYKMKHRVLNAAKC